MLLSEHLSKELFVKYTYSPACAIASACLFAASIGFAAAAMTDPLSVQATMVPKEQIKLDFKDGSGHFVLMVRREGNAAQT
jgi:hypothetical protein